MNSESDITLIVGDSVKSEWVSHARRVINKKDARGVLIKEQI